MNLYEIDRIAVHGASRLHRLPAGWKLLGVAAVIALVLAMPWWPLHVGVLAAVLLLAVSARLPMPVLLGLTAYPLIFLAILFFSMDGLTPAGAVRLALPVLAITATIITLLLTTSFPALFNALGRVLPAVLVAALFFTYRALFILATGLTNMHTAIHLRGGMSWKHPVRSLRNLGMGLGHLLVHVIETSQRMADNLAIRGFKNRVYTLGKW